MHFSTLAATALLTLANGAVVSKRANAGKATFYGGNTQGGTCSFSTYTIPSNLYGTALSGAMWDSSANCGACVSVTGPDGNKVTAMIVDKCPECETNHLDLFSNAFSALANPTKGIIPISWDYVDCGISSPLVLHNKEGVSAYWFSIQVVNANKRVKSLEFSTNGGSSWTATKRQDYNFFEYPSGSGTTTVDVKVTSVDGDVVVVKGVSISSGGSVTAGSNFGSGTSSPAPVSPKRATSAKPSPTSTKAAEVIAPTPVVESPTPTPDTPTPAPPAPVEHPETTPSASPLPVELPVEAPVLQETAESIAPPAPTTLITATPPASTSPASTSTSKSSTSTTTTTSEEPIVTVYVDACPA